MIRNRFVAAAALVAAGGAAACATDGPTAPAPAAVRSSGPRLNFGPSALPASWAGQRLTESQLKALEESEKKRLDANVKATADAQDSLKTIYERIKRADPKGMNTAALVCEPLPYKGEVKIIGPEGGTIQAGVHKLEIPRGALPYRTVITGEMAVGTGPMVRFSPHGLVFNAAAKPKLTMEYKHCLGFANWEARTIAYVSGDMTWLETPATTDVKNLGIAYANIGHFSGYVVGWSRYRRY